MISKFCQESPGLNLQASYVPWDSEVFDFPIAQVDCIVGRDRIELDNAVRNLMHWAGRNNLGMISCRLPHDALKASFALERHGFRFVEMVLHPTINELQERELPEPQVRVVAASKADSSTIQAIAENCFSYERFHADPRLDTSLANKRYGNWVVSCMESSSQELLKIMAGERLIGFFIVEEKPDQTAYWHLTAIEPKFQGQGYGRATWLAMLNYHRIRGIRKVGTTISARNIPVVNLYSQLQFLFLPPHMTFHWMPE